MDCSICTSSLFTAAKVRVVTSCGHIFHKLCVTPWLQERRSCPVCRRETHSQHLREIFLPDIKSNVEEIAQLNNHAKYYEEQCHAAQKRNEYMSMQIRNLRKQNEQYKKNIASPQLDVHALYVHDHDELLKLRVENKKLKKDLRDNTNYHNVTKRALKRKLATLDGPLAKISSILLGADQIIGSTTSEESTTPTHQ